MPPHTHRHHPSFPSIPLPKAPPTPTTPPQPSLQRLPADVLQRVICLLSCDPRSLYALSCTSRSLRASLAPFRRSGGLALPLPATRPVASSDSSSSSALRSCLVDGGRGVQIEKTTTPSHGVYVADAALGNWSMWWTVKLEKLRGRGVQVGVTEVKGGRFLEQEKSVYFDCAGRLCLGMRRRMTFGRCFAEGETVGVVYDGRDRTLMFLDGGVAMGPPVRLAMLPGVARGAVVYPFVKFGNVPAERVRLGAGGGVVDFGEMKTGYGAWRRQVGCAPPDGKVVVVTWNESVWYALRCDPDTQTLRQLRGELARRIGCSSFELIHDQQRLCDDDATLASLGVRMDRKSGSTKHDILLSIPHLVS